MKFIKQAALIFLALFTVSLFSCRAGDTGSQNDVRTFVDSYGREVTVASHVTRVVSLAPSITEVLFALDRGDLVVARSSYCDYPPEVSKIPEAGSLLEPNIEEIVTFGADIVIASDHFNRESVEALEQLGIPVFISKSSSSLDSLYTQIKELACIVDAQKEGESLVASISQSVADVKAAARSTDKPTVYYLLSFGKEGDYTAGGDTLISELIAAAGGENIGDDVSGWSYSVEQLYKRNPDIVICSEKNGIAERFKVHPLYKKLKAVQTGHVYTFNTDLVDRAGPRVARGVRVLYELIHQQPMKKNDGKL